mgnify:CR=1 FL=1
MGKQLVVFKLLNEDYAIEVISVESIIKYQSITVIPHAPDYVVGVTNLRGNIVPVIELKKRLSLPITEPNDETRIIVAIIKDSKVGMVVDSVSQVIEIGEGEMDPTPQMGLNSAVDASFIRGIVKIEGKLIISLDLEKVFFGNS